MSTYVYGFTHAAHPLQLEGVRGVGADGPPVRAVRHDQLAAVVSDAPENLRPKRRDLEAHQAILDSLIRAGTVLPMRFGMVAPDDGAVEAELESRAQHYLGLLGELDGKVELNVKGAHREEDILRALLLENRELREWNEALRASGGDHDARLEFGEEVAAALEEWRSAHADHLVETLRPHAVRMSLGPLVDGCFVNASFLVSDDGRSGFDQALADLREAMAPVADIRLYGPLPPYSFVAGEGSQDEPGPTHAQAEAEADAPADVGAGRA